MRIAGYKKASLTAFLFFYAPSSSSLSCLISLFSGSGFDQNEPGTFCLGRVCLHMRINWNGNLTCFIII